MIRSFVVLSFMMSASLAAAQASGEAAPAPAAKSAKEKKVCKLEDGETTSRMRRRVCRTVKEWNEPRDNTSAEDLRRVGGQ